MNTWPDEHPDRRADLRAAVSAAHAVFAVSRALAQRVRDVTGVDAIPLPLGCDHAWIEQASLPRAEARRLLGLPEERLIVLFVGYLLRQKGVRELASAILDVGDPFLGVFVGDGPERGYAADAPRASGRLLYQGSTSHVDVIRHMSAADVLVLPSYGEGLPTVLVEAGSVTADCRKRGRRHSELLGRIARFCRGVGRCHCGGPAVVPQGETRRGWPLIDCGTMSGPRTTPANARQL
jgi:teichuronic acid biosynthesis glycosyltransferase TuaC